jgi:hypothetical protein
VAGVANADGKGRDGVLVGAPYVKRDGRRAVGSASLYISRRKSRARPGEALDGRRLFSWSSGR